ncbi:unnamed protein product [Amoebophrya sp. A25]|nr:unnamed protein product [Amoebophrya sp. A25]|eukprot:GSA25T00010664001.1
MGGDRGVRHRSNDQSGRRGGQRNHGNRYWNSWNSTWNHATEEQKDTRKFSGPITKWLRYKMRDEFPDNDSNWVFWQAVPSAGEKFNEEGLRRIVEHHPDHLELYDADEDEAKHKGLYIRATRKNNEKSVGNDFRKFWDEQDIEDIKEKKRVLVLADDHDRRTEKGKGKKGKGKGKREAPAGPQRLEGTMDLDDEQERENGDAEMDIALGGEQITGAGGNRSSVAPQNGEAEGFTSYTGVNV